MTAADWAAAAGRLPLTSAGRLIAGQLADRADQPPTKVHRPAADRSADHRRPGGAR